MSWLLIKGGGQPWLICVYVAIVSLISTLSVTLMREGSRRDIDQDIHDTDTPNAAISSVREVRV